jgi:hypothetical protein
MKWADWLGWDRPTWRVFGGGVALLLLTPLIALRLGGAASVGILFALGVIVLFYTIEAHGVRREILRQNDIAIQPLVVATVEARPDRPGEARQTDRVVLRNIGRGAALSVQPADIVAHDERKIRCVVKFTPVDILEPGKDAVTEAAMYREEGAESARLADFIAGLKPDHATETYDVVIAYEDIGAQEYQSTMRMGKGGIRLLRPGQA